MAHITIVPALGILLVIFLCGSMKLSLINTSSFIYTSSATTLIPSILTHLPIIFFHPIILFLMIVCPFICELLRITTSDSLTPLPITQFSPIVTLGPITDDGSTVALLWINTFPNILSFFANWDGSFSLKYYK